MKEILHGRFKLLETKAKAFKLVFKNIFNSALSQIFHNENYI
jgi:hypothetical protein